MFLDLKANFLEIEIKYYNTYLVYNFNKMLIICYLLSCYLLFVFVFLVPNL